MIRPGSLLIAVAMLVSATFCAAEAQSPISSSSDFQRYAMRLREGSDPQGPAPSHRAKQWRRRLPLRPRFQPISLEDEYHDDRLLDWRASHAQQPGSELQSSWDPQWASNYGGFDDPDSSNRRNFIPGISPPARILLYVALPYNDVTHGTTKPEARRYIPWFKQAFERPRQIGPQGPLDRHPPRQPRLLRPQWEDCGPFRTDHFQYVFGNDRPLPNLNQGAGLDVSPAVRDYLGVNGKDYCDWKFVEARDVRPVPGPNTATTTPSSS